MAGLLKLFLILTIIPSSEADLRCSEELHDQTSLLQVSKKSVIVVDEALTGKSANEKTITGAAAQAADKHAAAATQAEQSTAVKKSTTNDLSGKDVMATDEYVVQLSERVKADPLPDESTAELAKVGHAVKAVSKYKALAKQKAADSKAALHNLQEKVQADEQNLVAEKKAIKANRAALNMAKDQLKIASAMEVLQEKASDVTEVSDDRVAASSKVIEKAAELQSARKKRAVKQAKDATKAATERKVAVKKAGEPAQTVGQRLADEEGAAALHFKADPSTTESAVEGEGETRMSAHSTEAKASVDAAEANLEAAEAKANETDLSEDSVTASDEDVAAMQQELIATQKYLAEMRANGTANATWWGQHMFNKAMAKAKDLKNKLVSHVKSQFHEAVGKGKALLHQAVGQAKDQGKDLLQQVKQTSLSFAKDAYKKAQAEVAKAASGAQDFADHHVRRALQKGDELKRAAEKNLKVAKETLLKSVLQGDAPNSTQVEDAAAANTG
jgi:hypothetical protein